MQPGTHGGSRSGGAGHRYLSLLFLAGLVLFVFPFMTVSCSGQEILSIRGYSMVFGGTVNVNTDFMGDLGSVYGSDLGDLYSGYGDYGSDWSDYYSDPYGYSDYGASEGRIPAQGWGIVAVVAAVLGLLTGLLATRPPGVYIALGAVGALGLLILRFSMNSDVGAAGLSMAGFSVSWSFAYWLAFLLFLGAAVAEGALLVAAQRPGFGVATGKTSGWGPPTSRAPSPASWSGSPPGGGGWAPPAPPGVKAPPPAQWGPTGPAMPAPPSAARPAAPPPAVVPPMQAAVTPPTAGPGLGGAGPLPGLPSPPAARRAAGIGAGTTRCPACGAGGIAGETVCPECRRPLGSGAQG